MSNDAPRPRRITGLNLHPVVKWDDAYRFVANASSALDGAFAKTGDQDARELSDELAGVVRRIGEKRKEYEDHLTALRGLDPERFQQARDGVPVARGRARGGVRPPLHVLRRVPAPRPRMEHGTVPRPVPAVPAAPAGGLNATYRRRRDRASVAHTGGSLPTAPTLSAITAASDGAVLGTDAHGLAYRLTSVEPLDTGTWETLTSSVSLWQLSAASATDVWGCTASGAVYRSQGTTWDPQPVTGTLSEVSAADDGTVWGVHAGLAYQYTPEGPSPWTQIGCQTQLSVVAVGDATGVFGLDAESGELLQYAGSPIWPALSPPPPVPLLDLSVTDDGLLWGIGSDHVLYLYVGPDEPWYPTAAALEHISAGSASNIWAIDEYGDPRGLQTGGEIFTEATTAPPGRLRWETESAYDQTRSTHLWIVYQAATLAAGAGPEGQAAQALVKPQPPTVKRPIGDPFHDNLCQGLYDADNVDPWRDLATFFQYVPWVGKYAATYKSHFYDPDTGRNWRGDTSPTALTRGRSVAAFALDCYLAGDMAHAGYYLGLALHYLTDVSQAMHAGNFTYLSSDPWGWHSTFETRVMQLTGTPGGVTPPASYSPSTVTDFDGFVVAAAANAKRNYLGQICPALVTHPERAVYDGHLVLVRSWETDTDTIWSQDALPAVGPMLRDSITYTAQFLVWWTTMAQSGVEVAFLACADSGQVMDVPHGLPFAVQVQQYQFNGGKNQQWIAVPLAGADAGYFRISSRLQMGSSPLVLDVKGQHTGPGTAVQIYPWKNQDNQKWKLVEGPAGTVRWQGKQSGSYLTVSNVSRQGSGLVIQPDGSPGQNWIAAPADVCTLGCAAGSLVADVPHGSGRTGQQLQLYTPNGGSNQRFLFVPVQGDPAYEDDELFVVLVASSGMALDITPSNQVVQWTWSGSPTQSWRRTPVVASGDTVVYLENASKPGWVISAATTGTTRSDLLVLAPTGNQPTQQWRIAEIGS